MSNYILKITLFFTFSVLTFAASSQTVERTSYAVFSPVAPNDSLLVAGGQIMSGETVSPLLKHGYFPLNYTLLSIDEPEMIQSYSIYPNPFQESFQVNWTNATTERLTVEIYTINGALITRIETTEAQLTIETDKWERGLYFVRGLTDQGTVFNEKVIKS